MEGAAEGKKELFWVGIKERFVQKKGFLYVKKAAFEGSSYSFLQKKSFWFVKMGIFCGQRRKARAKEILCVKNSFE